MFTSVDSCLKCNLSSLAAKVKKIINCFCDKGGRDFNGCFLLFNVQMAVAIEAMADGGVLVGIPRDISLRVAAQSMMVSSL